MTRIKNPLVEGDTQPLNPKYRTDINHLLRKSLTDEQWDEFDYGYQFLLSREAGEYAERFEKRTIGKKTQKKIDELEKMIAWFNEDNRLRHGIHDKEGFEGARAVLKKARDNNSYLGSARFMIMEHMIDFFYDIGLSPVEHEPNPYQRRVESIMINILHDTKLFLQPRLDKLPEDSLRVKAWATKAQKQIASLGDHIEPAERAIKELEKLRIKENELQERRGRLSQADFERKEELEVEARGHNKAVDKLHATFKQEINRAVEYREDRNEQLRQQDEDAQQPVSCTKPRKQNASK